MLRRWLGIELIEVSLVEKIVATVGGGLSILILVGMTHQAFPGSGGFPVITSMGASAVLLFAVPHGQLSQPWPVIAGHGLSATIGVACARFIHQPWMAAACAVGLAIGAMHLLRCIHPPGGATALTAVIGGEAIQSLGFDFVFFPVLTNAAVMVGLAMLINAPFHWRRYPSIPDRPSPPVPEPDEQPTHEEVLAAIRSIDSFIDISEQDLLRLVEILSQHPHRPPHASKSPLRPAP